MGGLLLFSPSWTPPPTRGKRKRTPTPPVDEHEAALTDSDNSSGPVSVSSEAKLKRPPSVASLVSYSSFESKNTSFSKRRSSFLSVGFAC